MVTTEDPIRGRLERAHQATEAVRVVRRISGSDVVNGYVVGIGRRWVLLRALASARVDGYCALRIADIARIQPAEGATVIRAVAETQGSWPPSAPETCIELDKTRGLILSAHACAALVALYVERDDPDVCFIGMPVWWADKSVYLQEVSPRGTWDDTVSRWRLSEITRIDFADQYQSDLLLVAQAPPAGVRLVNDEVGGPANPMTAQGD